MEVLINGVQEYAESAGEVADHRRFSDTGDGLPGLFPQSGRVRFHNPVSYGSKRRPIGPLASPVAAKYLAAESIIAIEDLLSPLSRNEPIEYGEALGRT